MFLDLQTGLVSQEPGKVIWYSHLLNSVPQFVVVHTVKDFCVVNETGVDVFLESSCFLYEPANAGNLIFGSFAFSKSSLYFWKSSIHVLFEHSWVLPFFGTRMKINLFPVLWPLLSFPNLLTYWMEHFNSFIFEDLK